MPVYKGPEVQPWKIDMCDTPVQLPAIFCEACCCAPCFAYSQRKFMIGENGIYKCCLGGIPCLDCDLPKECLIAEVCCCLHCSVAANRFQIQSAGQIANSQCDNCIIITAICCGCIASCMPHEGLAECFRRGSDCLYCSVIGCMLVQQQYEIDGSLQAFAPSAAIVPAGPGTESMK